VGEVAVVVDQLAILVVNHVSEDRVHKFRIMRHTVPK